MKNSKPFFRYIMMEESISWKQNSWAIKISGSYFFTNLIKQNLQLSAQKKWEITPARREYKKGTETVQEKTEPASQVHHPII